MPHSGPAAKPLPILILHRRRWSSHREMLSSVASGLSGGIACLGLPARTLRRTPTTYAVDRGCDSGSRMPGRREQCVELLVFLFLIVPSMAVSFFAVKQGSLGFALVEVATAGIRRRRVSRWASGGGVDFRLPGLQAPARIFVARTMPILS
jgi:hypothetical protein